MISNASCKLNSESRSTFVWTLHWIGYGVGSPLVPATTLPLFTSSTCSTNEQAGISPISEGPLMQIYAQGHRLQVVASHADVIAKSCED